MSTVSTKWLFKKMASIELRWRIKDTDIEFIATPMDVSLALHDTRDDFEVCGTATLFDFVNSLGIETDAFYNEFDPRNFELEQGWCNQCFDCKDPDTPIISLPKELEITDDQVVVLEFVKDFCSGLYDCLGFDHVFTCSDISDMSQEFHTIL